MCFFSLLFELFSCCFFFTRIKLSLSLSLAHGLLSCRWYIQSTIFSFVADDSAHTLTICNNKNGVDDDDDDDCDDDDNDCRRTMRWIRFWQECDVFLLVAVSSLFLLFLSSTSCFSLGNSNVNVRFLFIFLNYNYARIGQNATSRTSTHFDNGVYLYKDISIYVCMLYTQSLNFSALSVFHSDAHAGPAFVRSFVLDTQWIFCRVANSLSALSLARSPSLFVFILLALFESTTDEHTV